MKIFLGNSPWYKNGSYGVRAGSRWPHFESNDSEYIPFPFYLAYATALLEKEGFDVLLVDGIAERMSREQFLSKLDGFQPDLVLLEVSTASIDTDIEYATSIRESLPETKIVFCGIHSFMYEPQFLESVKMVDFVLVGEYENALLELCRAIETNRSVGEVNGVLFRDGNGSVKKTGPRPNVEDLNSFPWPAREHLPMKKYHDTPGNIPTPSLQMWSTRGCPFGCVFCAWPQIMYQDRKYRVRDVRDIVMEILHCKEKYGIRSVYFDDDTFNIGRDRLLAFCKEYIKQGVNLPWAAMSRADTSDGKVIETMAESGLKAIKFGIESADQEILDNSGKRLNIQKVRDTVKLVRELDVNYHLTFTLGLPGETMDTIRKTIDFAMELNPDSLQFSITTPFPGSKYYDMMEKKGFLLHKDWGQYDGYSTSVVETDTLKREELEEALKEANRRWKKNVLKTFFSAKRYRHLDRRILNPVHVYKRAKYYLS